MKIGRNDLCTCGSGQKYKKCCAAKDEAAESAALASQEAERAEQAAVAAKDAPDEAPANKQTKGTLGRQPPVAGAFAPPKSAKRSVGSMRKHGI